MATDASQFPTLSTKQGYRDFDQVVFVDVRNRYAYDEAHILGATSLPLEEIEENWQAFAPDQQLVIYGDSSDDTAPYEASQFLRDKGYQRLSILQDGLQGWARAGYPIDEELYPEQRLGIQSEFRQRDSQSKQ